MSYCRFQNTVSDFDDCLEAFRNEERVSGDELRAAKRLAVLAGELIQSLADECGRDVSELLDDSDTMVACVAEVIGEA